MEGGAHVLMEAICSGTPVLASRINGNVGLLGEDYAGLFAPGNPQALADLMQACRSPRTGHALMAHLRHQCALRAPLFEPRFERAALHRWVHDLWTL
jgi:glycosyltransferase involved in cell wall biosynthesis